MSPNFNVSPNLQYFKKLTTKIGMFQHGNLNKPDPKHGYSIDDNARALIVAYQIFENFNDNYILQLSRIYLGYLTRSKIKGGYFHNFADKNNVYLDDVGSETSTGRAIWALGYVASREGVNHEQAVLAKRTLQDLPSTSLLFHIRSKAYALIGYYYIKDKARVNLLARSLVESFNRYKNEDWFEDNFEYANGILSFALFLAYNLTKNKNYLKTAEKSYIFLDKMTRKPNFVCPIGHNGHKIGSKRVETYDQQAIEAADMVLAAKAGFLATGNTFYNKSAYDWFAWFLGNNVKKISLLNGATGACFDGITPTGLNKNNGAESVLCYLLAYNAMSSDKVLQ